MYNEERIFVVAPADVGGASGIKRMSQCLIFDADDTLWENNIYFERAVEEFLDLMTPITPDQGRVRDVLCEVEKENIPQWGYGSRNFIDSLGESFRRLYAGRDGVAYLQSIGQIGDRLLNHPIQVLPGVVSALEILRDRYRLLLFTKGNREEQLSKLDRSGLGGYFERMEIVAEKNPSSYDELIRRHSLDPDATCMIGNSPRSDINPALEVGLWAIFIPHPHTWELEKVAVQSHPRLLFAESIREIPHLLCGGFPPSR